MATRIEPGKAALFPRGERVYFIEAGDLIKIGRTRNLAVRFAGLRTQSPVPLRLLGSIPGYRYMEESLRAHFAADRVHGEWFKVSDDLRALATGELVFTGNGLQRPKTEPTATL